MMAGCNGALVWQIGNDEELGIGRIFYVPQLIGCAQLPVDFTIKPMTANFN